MSYDIDDSLYSRQRCVLGENAMKRMCKSKVFLHGLGGVGIEIAKNLILAGVGELIIQDQSLCSEQDLGTQFYVDDCSVKCSKTRAEASLDRLTALNPYVRITLKMGNVADIRCPLSDPANKTILKPLVDKGSSTKVDCLVLTQCSLQQATLLDLFCRAHDIKFIYTDIYGAFGNLFCDFGSDFTVLTQDDETCREFFIGKIEKINDEELLITVLGNHRHHLENNDVIRFTELKNVPMLNEREFLIRVKSPSELIITMSIKDIQFPYSDGGVVLQVKKPQVHTFETMLEQIKYPKLMCVDFSEPEEGNLLHLTYLTLMRFNVENGRYPKPWDENDWNLFRDQLFTIQKLQMVNPIEINESLVKRLTFASQGQLAPLCAIFGGIAAQEAMKAITFTFTPINQWLYIHCASIVPLEINTKSNEFQNYLSSRYADLVQCIGVSNLQKIHNLSVFMVGCGAIGCELLKNLALLGVATAGSNDDNLHSANNMTHSNQHQYEQQEDNKQFTYTTTLHTSLMSHVNDDVEDHHQTLSHSTVDGQQQHCNSSYPEDKLTGNSETIIKSFTSHQVSTSQRQSINSVQSESINSMINMSCPNIIVTDPDHIEKSNLNRQFLFQSCHIGLSKSQIACDTVKRINPNISVRAMCDKFWPNTEKSIFTDEFLLQATKCSNYKQGITSSSSSSHKYGIVLAALDCVPTRRYLDSRCVTLHLPLIESGTLGTKGHVQVILPDITESYNSQMDDNNDVDGNGNIDSQVNTIPYCTLKSFPTLPIHCIEWAREKFASQFTLKPMKLQTFLQAWNMEQSEYMDSYHGEQTLQKQTHQLISDLIFLMNLCNENTTTTTTTTTTDNHNSSINVIVTSNIYANDKILMKNWIERINLLQDQLSPNIGRFLCSRPSTWNECLYLARDKFQHYFNHKARQLLHSFPIDTKLSDGSPFWQFPKRPPKSIEFSITDPLHQIFVISYARLLAAQLSIEVPQSCFSSSISNSLSSSTSLPDFSSLLNYGSTELVNYLKEVFVNYIPPMFTPSNKHIVIDENEPKPQQTTTSTSPSLPKDNDHTIMSMKRIIFSNPSLNDDDSTIKEICLNESFLKMCTNILESLSKPEKFKVISSCQSVTFEKDDDNLAHVDFVMSAANLRATMYSLPITARHVVKRIAGRIVPAIATTTATVAGLVCLELLKYVINNNQYDVNGGHVGSFASEEEINTITATTRTINDPEQCLIQLKSRNSFLNLALPILLFSEPGLCRQIRLPNGKYFSLWDRWIIRPCKSIDKYRLIDFIDQIKNDFNLVVSLITQGNRMVYMHHFPMHKSRFNEIFISFLNYSSMDSHIDLMVAYESDHMKVNNNHSHGNNDDDDGGCIQGPTIRFKL